MQGKTQPPYLWIWRPARTGPRIQGHGPNDRTPEIELQRTVGLVGEVHSPKAFPNGGRQSYRAFQKPSPMGKVPAKQADEVLDAEATSIWTEARDAT